MNVETVVCAYPDDSSYGSGRFGVFARLDGTLTSWDCTHLHHSAKAAEKCRATLRSRVEEWLAQPTVTISEVVDHPMGPGLYEIAYLSAEPGVTLTSRRFQMPYDRVVEHVGFIGPVRDEMREHFVADPSAYND